MRALLTSGLLSVMYCLPAHAVAYNCATSGFMSGANNCLLHGGMGIVGGVTKSTANEISDSNMYPWQKQPQQDSWHTVALAALDEGKAYLESLNMFNEVPMETNPPSVASMLLHPEQNYGDAGFTACTDTGPSSIGEKLKSAIATFAYELYVGYPAVKQSDLTDAIKVLASIYLIIGNEYLVDSMEWRFSSQTLSLGMDQRLGKQLDDQLYLLNQASNCYNRAVDTFVDGFSPTAGTSFHISELFDATLMNLFHIAVERLSTTFRETTAKTLARQISAQNRTTAVAESQALLKDTYTITYLLTAALGQKEGNDYFVNNGGERLRTALQSLQSQSAIFTRGLNPLGFDDRYVPMQDFNPTLYGRARDSYNAVATSQAAFDAEKREFDHLADSLRAAQSDIALNVYREKLASYTGISASSITTAMIPQLELAGYDLYDCDIDDDAFSTCVQTKTKGVLNTKYQEIRKAQFQVESATLQRKQLLEKIEMENRRFNNLLQIENKYNADYKNTLETFLKKLDGARTVTRQKTKCNKGCKGTSKKEKRTITTYNLVDEPLQINTEEEIKMQQLLTDYKIRNLQTNHEVDLMNLLHSVAETEIQIGLAIQLKNSAVDDFENMLADKDNLVFLFGKSSEYQIYTEAQLKDRISEARVMRSEAALNLARDMNAAVHRTYLAAKALEFKYLTPLENIALDGGQYLDINDLYKVQTMHDLDEFQQKLNNYDTCSWGSVSPRLYKVSLAQDILGYTDTYLEGLGAVTTVQKNQLRYQKLQEFLNGHIDPDWNDVSFPFSISLNDEVISRYRKYNMKIWWGSVLPPCDPIEAKGVTVMISTNQAAYLEPYVTLKLSGSQSFLNSSGEIMDYVPVSNYLNMQSISTDSSVVTVGSFDAFINTDPDTVSMHEWTNSFKGRSLASSNWEILIEDFSYPADIDWSKVTDITFYFDTMAMQLQ